MQLLVAAPCRTGPQPLPSSPPSSPGARLSVMVATGVVTSLQMFKNNFYLFIYTLMRHCIILLIPEALCFLIFKHIYKSCCEVCLLSRLSHHIGPFKSGSYCLRFFHVGITLCCFSADLRFFKKVKYLGILQQICMLRTPWGSFLYSFVGSFICLMSLLNCFCKF